MNTILPPSTSTIVSLRRHADGSCVRLFRSRTGEYQWELDDRKRTGSTERHGSFFAAMLSANNFMERRGHNCQREGCRGWLLGRDLRAALAADAPADAAGESHTAPVQAMPPAPASTPAQWRAS